MSETLDPTTRAALERLIVMAQCGTGQSRRCADFLLAWWNPVKCGGFALTDTWGMDDELASACVRVFGWIVINRAHPKGLGYGEQFEALAKKWRPHA